MEHMIQLPIEELPEGVYLATSDEAQGRTIQETIEIARDRGQEADRGAERPGRDAAAAGSHEIWFNPALNRYTTIPNHPGDMPEGTLRAILKQAGIDAHDFLQKK